MKKEGREAFSCFFMYYSIARSGVAATRVAKMPIDQGCHPRRVFWIYIYNVRCHRYLHAKFQEDWPKKKLKTFQLKFCCNVFGPDCTRLKVMCTLKCVSPLPMSWTVWNRSCTCDHSPFLCTPICAASDSCPQGSICSIFGTSAGSRSDRIWKGKWDILIKA